MRESSQLSPLVRSPLCSVNLETDRSLVKSSIKSIYAEYKKGIVITAIAVLSFSFIYTVYTQGGAVRLDQIAPSIYSLFKEELRIPLVTIFFKETNVDGDRALLLIRVSTESQDSNSSKPSQREALKKDANEHDLDIAEVLEAAESGAEIDRTQLNTALELAQDDEYDILMVYDIDRLSRADPWDTMQYLHKLRDEDITIYKHSYGFFDWDSYYDFEILGREAAFSRRWLDRIKDGAARGCRRKLKHREWPYGGDPPVGYTTDEDGRIQIDSEYKEFIPELFRVYVQTGNRKETMRQVNQELKHNDLTTVSYNQVKTILQSSLCVGNLKYKDEIVRHCNDLQLVDEELYDDVQSMLSGDQSGTAKSDVPDIAAEVTEEFGLNYLFELIDSFKPFRCRECNGDLEQKGTTEIWDIPFPQYRCTSCDYLGPLISEEELKQIHQTLPLRCPFCGGTEQFTTSRVKRAGTNFDYEYTCDVCDYSFGTNLSPNKIQRYLECPNLGFEVGESDQDEMGAGTASGPQSDLTEFENA